MGPSPCCRCRTCEQIVLQPHNGHRDHAVDVRGQRPRHLVVGKVTAWESIAAAVVTLLSWHLHQAPTPFSSPTLKLLCWLQAATQMQASCLSMQDDNRHCRETNGLATHNDMTLQKLVLVTANPAGNGPLSRLPANCGWWQERHLASHLRALLSRAAVHG